jgi:nicotinamide-nucleotide adenylyltransferase
MNKPTVTIEYCEECMYLQPALEAAHTILTRYADRVGAVILKPGHGGIFRVTADGAVIIEMGDEGLPTAERVAQALEQASLDVHLRQPMAGEGEQSRRSLARRGLFLGRFQPYHNGHHAVIKQILQSQEIDELIIAIGSAQESHTLKDPFTAGERILMITKALHELKPSITTYVLPIEDIARNSLYVAHIRSLTPPFEIVYSNNPLVQQLFEERGIVVRALPYVERAQWDGTKIRELMLQGDQWKEHVPAAVAQVIEEINGVARLRRICQSDKPYAERPCARE